MLSIVRGQVNLISTQKNGQISLTAKVFIALYILISVSVKSYILFLAFPFKVSNLPNDFMEKYPGTPLATSPINFIIVMPTVGILQIILSFVIIRKLFGRVRNAFHQAVWSVLAPPLFLDWDEHYRFMKFNVSITECWRVAKTSILTFNLLQLLCNVAWGIPLYIEYYRTPALTRARFFRGLFSSYEDQPDGLPIFALLSCAISSQILLIGLSYFYFKRLHPWSRLLRAELDKSGEE